ncbi:MAG: lasso peptide biosynthesis B2 protein, partial [Pseudonocardiaceae bacterium]
MTGYVSCPSHVRSANLGTLTALVDLRTGRVDALLGWAHDMWSALARTGDSTSAATAVDGASADQVTELVRHLRADGLLDTSPIPRPWMVPEAPATTPSWGTHEVPAGTLRPGQTTISTTILAGVALSSVLVARCLGRRSRSFSRIVALLTESTRWPRRRAEPASVEHALHCVRNCASVLPFRVACLEETAAAMLVLACKGQRAGWCHGIAADPIRLHAWIALDGRPVAEPASTSRYTPLLHIS